MKLFAKDIPPGSHELSGLAIIETLAACALALYFTLQPKWMAWLALYVCLAPLLLLRTKASVRLGLVWYNRGANMVMKPLEFVYKKGDSAQGIWQMFYIGQSFVIVVISTLALTLLAIPVKVCATIAGVFRRPLSCFRSISANWAKQVARTDSTLMPELLPGVRRWILTTEGRMACVRVIAGPDIICKDLFKNEKIEGKIFLTFLFSLAIILPFAFGLLYRWALKATALVWLPLAFFLNGVFRKHDSLSWRVTDLMKGPWAVFLSCYAVGVLCFNGLLPLALRTLYLDATIWLKAKMFPDVLMRYFFLRPATATPQVLVVEAWHVAGLLSAAITLLLYAWAGSLRNRMDNGGYANDEEKRSSLRKIQYTLAARALLTTYTMLCGVVAFAKAANWEWAQFTVRWLP